MGVENSNHTPEREEVPHSQDQKEIPKYIPLKEKLPATEVVKGVESEEKNSADRGLFAEMIRDMTDAEKLAYIENRIGVLQEELKRVKGDGRIARKEEQAAERGAMLDWVESQLHKIAESAKRVPPGEGRATRLAEQAEARIRLEDLKASLER